MTTEDDFHRALDVERSDRMTYLVFADWLDDREDPRAEGYRALGVLTLSPKPIHRGLGSWYDVTMVVAGIDPESNLPHDWFTALLVCAHRVSHCPHNIYFTSPLTARDAAALAFASLPADRRAELLTGAPI